jgi:hypothetical protein
MMGTRRVLAGLLLAFGPLGCLWPGPFTVRGIHGQVQDRDTGEPVPGVAITLSYRARDFFGGTTSLYHSDVVESDADGGFVIDGHVTPSVRMWLLATDGPFVYAHHPVYSVDRGKHDDMSGAWRFEATLLTGRVVEESVYANGQPRFEGEMNAGGRNGLWVFYREDGTVTAQGQYEGGNAVGRWDWFDRAGRLVKTLGCRYVRDPRVSVGTMALDGSVFYVPPPFPRKPCDRAEEVGP